MSCRSNWIGQVTGAPSVDYGCAVSFVRFLPSRAYNRANLLAITAGHDVRPPHSLVLEIAN